ncbi:MAG: hypothetical protein ABEI80_06925 [Haloplanus sp.]
MDPTTRRDYDDELAQEAPLVPDLGRPDENRRTRADGRGAMTARPSDSTPPRHAPDDELAQQAPLVPDLGRRRTPNTDPTDR